MNPEIECIYRNLCYVSNIPIDQYIMACMSNVSTQNELDLKSSTLSEISCSLISETLKKAPKVVYKINLADCLLSLDSLNILIDVVDYLRNLSYLNLKGNKIGPKSTICISNMLKCNSTITELHLDWNNIGYSEEAFAQLCNSLVCNTTLVTLNLGSNNLDNDCMIHLAKVLQKNKCLKFIDISWNSIGNRGIVYLLEYLRKNTTLTNLNVQGNMATSDTMYAIENVMQQNKLNELEQQKSEMRNVCILEQLIASDKKNQAQIKQYQCRIEELESKLCVLQNENEQKIQELDFLKKKDVKHEMNCQKLENELNLVELKIQNQTQSLNNFIQKYSREMSNDDLQELSTLEDVEKIKYIVKTYEKKCNNKIMKERQSRQQLTEELPKFANESNAIKEELNIVKMSVKNGLKYFNDKLDTIKNINFTTLMNHGELEKICKDFHLKYNAEVQNELKISQDQTKMLIILSTELQKINNEKLELQLQLKETRKKILESFEKNRVLESCVVLAKNESQKLNEEKLSKITEISSMQNRIITLNEELNKLKNNVSVKSNLIEGYKENEKRISIYENKILELEQQLESNKRVYQEERKKNLNGLEIIRDQFSNYINLMKQNNRN